MISDRLTNRAYRVEKLAHIKNKHFIACNRAVNYGAYYNKPADVKKHTMVFLSTRR